MKKLIVVLVTLSLTLPLFIGCGGKQTIADLPASDLFKLGLERYENKKWMPAVDYFQSIVYNFPGNSIVDSAQYYLAMSYFGNEDYALAEVEFNRLLNNYPSSVFAPSAQYMKAVSAFEKTPKNPGLDQTELDDAIRQLEDFLIDRPESEFIPQAQEYLLKARTRLAKKVYSAGVVYSRIQAHTAAKIYYQRVADDYTDTEYAPLAIFALAKEEMEIKNYESARAKFEGFLSSFPNHEKAGEARKLMEQSAFRDAVKAFESGDYPKAQEKFNAYKQAFPQSEGIKKADEYLARITAQPTDESPRVQSGS